MHNQPPSRYRIVERDRRLVVIDTWQDGTQPPDTPQHPNSPFRRIAFDGRATLTTHALYDSKGPRTIMLDPGSAATLKGIRIALILAVPAIAIAAWFAPILIVAPIVLLQRGARARLRAAATAWLDRAGSLTDSETRA